MTNEEISNTRRECKSRRRSSGMALVLMIGSSIIFVGILCMTAGDFQIKPTQIIVKTEECSFLRQYGIATTDAMAGNGNCTVTVPYRVNSFGGGGLIVIENGPQIKIPDSQVVIVASLENQPWTPSQTRSAILLVASSTFMLLTMARFFMLIFTSKSREAIRKCVH